MARSERQSLRSHCNRTRHRRAFCNCIGDGGLPGGAALAPPGLSGKCPKKQTRRNLQKIAKALKVESGVMLRVGVHGIAIGDEGDLIAHPHGVARS